MRKDKAISDLGRTTLLEAEIEGVAVKKGCLMTSVRSSYIKWPIQIEEITPLNLC
jgi:hypothetical protein